MKSEPMNLNEVATEDLVAMLRHVSVETGSLACLGCGHEHNCGTRGCALIREAADRLDALRGPAIIPQAEMTREEAIVQIYGLKKYCEDMADSDESGSYVFDLDVQALDLALTALRPVSREQVERMAGEWVQDINKGPAVFYCSFCGESFEIHSYEFQKYRFCPFCMSPMTEEAVDMVMERLEALKDGNGV